MELLKRTLNVNQKPNIQVVCVTIIEKINMSLRNFKITRKKGEWYNTEVTDSYGNEYQNWYETAEEASDWIHYVWGKEDWFNSIDSQELLYQAIQQCKAIDKEKGIGSIL
mgnify:CR=1 FL=1